MDDSVPTTEATPILTPAPRAADRRAPGTIGSGRSVVADAATAVALVGDLLAALVGLVVGYWIRFRSGLIPLQPDSKNSWWSKLFTTSMNADEITLAVYGPLITMGAVFLIATFLYQGVYRPEVLLRMRRVMSLMARGLIFWFVAFLSISLVLRFEPPISRIYMLSSFIACMVMLGAWRTLLHRVLSVGQVAANLRQSVLFVGWNDEASVIDEAIFKDSSHPYQVIGAVPAPGGFAKSLPGHIANLGTYAELERILGEERADIVVLTDVNIGQEAVVDLSKLCERTLVQFKVVPNYFQILVSGLRLDSISGVPIMGVAELPLNRLINRIGKRAVDIVGSIVGLTLSAPALAWCAWLVRRESPGPVFFGQERVGRNGRRFIMYKVRSMEVGSERSDSQNQSTLRDDPRVLKVGRWMRRWNLDEVPQFWNVLRGEMSLVGPRPERTFHSERLSTEIDHYNARYACKPGMTGWAQVHGLRGDTNLIDRVRYDLYYLENWSLILDFQIMVQTFFRRQNAY
jgi:exopolysaccharide biosynthesis polyprenyl glycosylphosphotransferase